MKFEIETARHQHLVKSETALREKHAKFIAKLAEQGHSARVHQSPDPVEAYVNNGRWVGMCECGAGVALDPAFSAAYCHGCGAIHATVMWPSDEDRLNIEHVLLARPKNTNRNWDVGEQLRELLADNGEHGVRL